MAIYRTETASRDHLLTKDELAEPEVRVLLTLMFCSACSLVQIGGTILPEVLFGGDYPYFSSVSSTLLAHSQANAEELIERLRLDSEALVVEIASNDGYMLKNFARRRGAVRRATSTLCFCPHCGFVWNGAFAPARMSYEEDYEATQAVSATFNAFHERLASDVIARFDLHRKEVVEIGCGHGQFLPMLAELGDDRGIGFDQVHRGGSIPGSSSSRTCTSRTAICSPISSAAR